MVFFRNKPSSRAERVQPRLPPEGKLLLTTIEERHDRASPIELMPFLIERLTRHKTAQDTQSIAAPIMSMLTTTEEH